MVDKEIKYFDIVYKYKEEKFIIKKGTQRKTCIEREKEDRPLCIVYVGRFIGRNLPIELKKDRKQRKVKVILEGIVIGSLIN